MVTYIFCTERWGLEILVVYNDFDVSKVCGSCLVFSQKYCLMLSILWTQTYKTFTRLYPFPLSGKMKRISLLENEPPSAVRNRAHTISSALPDYGQTACLKEVHTSGPDNGKFTNGIIPMTLQRTEHVHKQKYLYSDWLLRQNRDLRIHGSACVWPSKTQREQQNIAPL
jgi:hypothetical protein